jgi:hypothetical protein
MLDTSENTTTGPDAELLDPDRDARVVDVLVAVEGEHRVAARDPVGRAGRAPGSGPPSSRRRRSSRSAVTPGSCSRWCRAPGGSGSRGFTARCGSVWKGIWLKSRVTSTSRLNAGPGSRNGTSAAAPGACMAAPPAPRRHPAAQARQSRRVQRVWPGTDLQPGVDALGQQPRSPESRSLIGVSRLMAWADRSARTGRGRDLHAPAGPATPLTSAHSQRDPGRLDAQPLSPTSRDTSGRSGRAWRSPAMPVRRHVIRSGSGQQPLDAVAHREEHGVAEVRERGREAVRAGFGEGARALRRRLEGVVTPLEVDGPRCSASALRAGPAARDPR